MRAAAACILAGITLASQALGTDEPAVMASAEFRDLVEGRTVHYTYEGDYYGSERFYDGDLSTWQNPSGSCEQGHWWADGEELCFRYGVVSCWKVFIAGDSARYAVSRSGLKVDINRIDDRPLTCEGDPVS